MTFKWKTGSRITANAQVAGEMCTKMEADGTLTAQNLVDVNRPEDAPLHGAFEWNDTQAAENWRVHQARHIINSIVLVTEDTEAEPVRYFFKVEPAEANYESLPVIVRNEDKYASLLKTALRELSAFQKKYRQIKELSAVFEAIDNLEEAV